MLKGSATAGFNAVLCSGVCRRLEKTTVWSVLGNLVYSLLEEGLEHIVSVNFHLVSKTMLF